MNFIQFLIVSAFIWIVKKCFKYYQIVYDVKLLTDTKALEEVVVVGYGTMKKSDVTGAITSLKAKDITAIPTTNALRSLQGKVSEIDIWRLTRNGAHGIVLWFVSLKCIL